VEHQLDYARVSIYAPSRGGHKAIIFGLDIRTIHEKLGFSRRSSAARDRSGRS
jgi:hypothetical protein